MTVASQPRAGDALLRILAFTLAISVMSGTMFNLALPEIMRTYRLSFGQVSWVTSSYLLIFAVGTVLYGKLADNCRLKTLLTVGILLLSAGCVIGLTARSYETVLAGRMIQAAGSAVIPAMAGILPVRYFPPETRGRAIGIAMTGGAIGSAIGPAVAALLIGAVHWRYLFGVPMLTLLALPFYRIHLREEPRRARGSIDWLGGVLLAGFVASTLLAITNRAWTVAAGALLLLLLFALRTRRARDPFIRPALLRHSRYVAGLSLVFLSTSVSYALPFLSPQLLTQVHHLPSGWIGLAMMPAAVVTAALGHTGGKLADRHGNGPLFYAALLLYLACFALLSSFTGSAPPWIALFLVFGNVGQSFAYIALSGTISRMLPQDQVGIGMGILSMLNFIAGAVSASLYGTTVDRGAAEGWNPLQTQPGAFVYSNLYLVLSFVIIAMMIIYYAAMQRGRTSPSADAGLTERSDLS
ncbi:MFS transporter [Cohnella sp. REN36]|uniref:MFS transporter n=1 Tax=Cohnella sp. REN36 TaxID=2887347 RepID=UPI001D153C5E|nr:MFS transporter [Cohnella sp. REN36]MCC3372714.1 MFS transporter [Cohnella sp. REN36]